MGEDLAIPDEREGEEITFTLDGTELEGREGDTVASALHAHGIKVLYRSVRYHRPRGYFCGVGKCANCLMRVDGEPNVRACTRELEEGTTVESQKGWPSARRDVLGLVDRLFPDGFDYHERFLRPKVLVPLYNAVIRRLAGFGDPPDRRDPEAAADGTPTRTLAPDVVVAGAGPAGLAAAEALVDRGQQVLVLEERPRAGGSLRLHHDRLGGKTRYGNQTGPEAADALAADLDGHQAVRLLRNTPVLGIYPPAGDGHRPTARDAADAAEPLVVARSPDALWEVTPQRLVLAPGTYQAPLRIPNNDLPGVMGARAARLLLEKGVRPGARAVVAGDGPEALRAARALHDAGTAVAAVAGDLPDGDPPADVPVRPDARAAAAHGSGTLEAVTLETPDGEERLEADTLVAATRRYPRPELLQQARVPLSRADGVGALYPDVDAVGRSGRDRTWVAGEAADPMSPALALVHGRAAGLAVARSLGAGGHVSETIDRLRTHIDDALGDRP